MAKKKKPVVAPETEEEPVEVTVVEAKPAPAPAPAPANVGSDIAAAIVEGLKESKEDKSIKIVTDPSVRSRFSIVKNAGGEVFTRDNESGELSALQLKSLEEKKAAEQEQDVQVL